MDLFAKLLSEGNASLDNAAITVADTHGNRFAKVALSGKDLSSKESIVNALAEMGETRVPCSFAVKIDHEGKKVTVAKADRGDVAARPLALAWGEMVGVHFATTPEPTPAFVTPPVVPTVPIAPPTVTAAVLGELFPSEPIAPPVVNGKGKRGKAIGVSATDAHAAESHPAVAAQ